MLVLCPQLQATGPGPTVRAGAWRPLSLLPNACTSGQTQKTPASSPGQSQSELEAVRDLGFLSAVKLMYKGPAGANESCLGLQAKDGEHAGPHSLWTRGLTDPSKARTVPHLIEPAAGHGRAPQNYTSGPLHRGGRGAGQEAWLTQLLLGFLPAPSRAPWAVVAHVPFLVVLAIS